MPELVAFLFVAVLVAGAVLMMRRDGGLPEEEPTLDTRGPDDRVAESQRGTH